MQVPLQRHPSFPSEWADEVYVDISRSQAGLLDLWYVVQGDPERLVIPPPVEGKRADNLWRTTCFELFLKPKEGTFYLEFNFSPSGEWAAYAFDGPREGMRDADLPSPPIVSVIQTPWRAVETHVTLPLELPSGSARWSLNLAAIVEEKGLGRSFWALEHPAGEPDFHDPACFTLELPPPAEE
jgi:hypothetical protein